MFLSGIAYLLGSIYDFLFTTLGCQWQTHNWITQMLDICHMGGGATYISDLFCCLINLSCFNLASPSSADISCSNVGVTGFEPFLLANLLSFDVFPWKTRDTNVNRTGGSWTALLIYHILPIFTYQRWLSLSCLLWSRTTLILSFVQVISLHQITIHRWWFTITTNRIFLLTAIHLDTYTKVSVANKKNNWNLQL